MAGIGPYLKRAAAVPVRPREARNAVISPPGESTALKLRRMYAREAGRIG